MRVVYTFKGNANAGFVGATGGSFIRPPPPYHNAYHGVSHVSYQVDLLDRSMQALAKSDVEIISPEYREGNFGYRSAYFATNSKAYVKLVQPNTNAGSSVKGDSSFNRGQGTPQSGFPTPGDPTGDPTGNPTGNPQSANSNSTSTGDSYRQATIGLAVVLALLVSAGAAVVYAKRRQRNPSRWNMGTSLPTKRESKVNLTTPTSESSSEFEMGSINDKSDQSVPEQQNPAY